MKSSVFVLVAGNKTHLSHKYVSAVFDIPTGECLHAIAFFACFVEERLFALTLGRVLFFWFKRMDMDIWTIGTTYSMELPTVLLLLLYLFCDFR